MTILGEPRQIPALRLPRLRRGHSIWLGPAAAGGSDSRLREDIAAREPARRTAWGARGRRSACRRPRVALGEECRPGKLARRDCCRCCRRTSGPEDRLGRDHRARARGRSGRVGRRAGTVSADRGPRRLRASRWRCRPRRAGGCRLSAGPVWVGTCVPVLPPPPSPPHRLPSAPPRWCVRVSTVRLFHGVVPGLSWRKHLVCSDSSNGSRAFRHGGFMRYRQGHCSGSPEGLALDTLPQRAYLPLDVLPSCLGTSAAVRPAAGAAPGRHRKA